MVENLNNKSRRKPNKYDFIKTIFTIIAMIFVVFACIVICCFEEQDIANCVIGTIFKIFRYCGIVLAIYSAGQLIMAYKNNDAELKFSAFTMFFISLIFIL